VTAPVPAAARASGTTLIPGLCRKSREIPGPLEQWVGQLPQAIGVITRQDARGFDGNALGEQEHIARACSLGRDQLLGGHLTQHRSAQNRAIQSGCYLGMAADELCTHLRAGTGDLLEDRFDEGLVACFPGEQQGGQEPARGRTAGGHVIGVHMHRIPSDLFGGEGDRIRLCDKQPVAEIQHRTVQPNARAEQYTRIIRRVFGKETGEIGCREFAKR